MKLRAVPSERRVAAAELERRRAQTMPTPGVRGRIAGKDAAMLAAWGTEACWHGGIAYLVHPDDVCPGCDRSPEEVRELDALRVALGGDVFDGIAERHRPTLAALLEGVRTL